MKPKKILNMLISAGPTREPLDPVRFISNYSTGFFGYAIAKEAKKRGHRVVLVSGPTVLAKPKGVRLVPVQTAAEMQKKLNHNFSWCDCVIMTAAVCDFRSARRATSKIKRGTKQEKELRLKRNPDILQGLGRKKGRKLLVGVALETEALKKHAQRKLKQKNLDLIVATQMNSRSYPFGPAPMKALILDKSGRQYETKALKKVKLARILLDSVEGLVLS